MIEKIVVLKIIRIFLAMILYDAKMDVLFLFYEIFLKKYDFILQLLLQEECFMKRKNCNTCL